MKVHTIKYLKIAMICSVIRFVENNRVNKIVILLPLAAIFFFLKWKRGYDVRLDKERKMAEADVNSNDKAIASRL